jgi:hypothetical protein
VRCQKAVADMKQKLEAECVLRKKLEKEVKAMSLECETGKEEVCLDINAQKLNLCFRGFAVCSDLIWNSAVAFSAIPLSYF